jgi:O-antigen/teichoic acid export membrane protein
MNVPVLERAMSLTTADLAKIATGTTMAFSGAVLGNGIAYLFGLVFGRALGAEALGLYFLAQILMQFANAACRIGLPEGLLRFVAVHLGNQDLPKVKGTVIGALTLGTATSTLAALVLFFFSDYLSIQMFKEPGLSLYLRWFAVTLPFFSIFILVTNAIQALKRMDFVVVSRDFVQPVSMLLLALGFFYFVPGPVSFLAAYLTSIVVGLITSVSFLACVVPNFDKMKLQSPKPVIEWKLLLIFCLPIAGSDIAYYLFRWADTFLLSVLRSPAEVGIYNAALRTTLLLNLVAVSVNALYAPIIADHHHQGRDQEIHLILKTLLRWCLTFALPIVFAMAFLSGEILSLWGPEFMTGSTALSILALSQLIFIAGNILGLTLLMCGKQYLELGNTVLITILNIALNLMLIPRFGITGAAIAMLASQLMGVLLRLGEVRSVLRMQLYTSKYLKPFMALLPVSVLMYLFQHSLATTAKSVFLGSHVVLLTVMLMLICGGYFATLYLLGIEKEDSTILREVRLTGGLPFLTHLKGSKK